MPQLTVTPEVLDTGRKLMDDLAGHKPERDQQEYFPPQPPLSELPGMTFTRDIVGDLPLDTFGRDDFSKDQRIRAWDLTLSRMPTAATKGAAVIFGSNFGATSDNPRSRGFYRSGDCRRRSGLGLSPLAGAGVDRVQHCGDGPGLAPCYGVSCGPSGWLLLQWIGIIPVRAGGSPGR